MKIVRSEKKDKFSGVPVPSATNSRPPSPDTMTHESAARVGVPQLDSDGEVVGVGNSSAFRDPGSEGGDCCGLPGFECPLRATLRRCLFPLRCCSSEGVGKARLHGSQREMSWRSGHSSFVQEPPLMAIAQYDTMVHGSGKESLGAFEYDGLLLCLRVLRLHIEDMPSPHAAVRSNGALVR